MAIMQAQPPLVPQAATPIGGASQFGSASLYVGDLDHFVTETQLFEIFSRVGVVLSIRVCKDLITNRSLGYAYVNYNSPQDATRALELLNFTPINGKPVRIMFSNRDPSIRKSGTGNIFIKNLDRSIDNKALYDTFSAFGPILSCKVAIDNNGQSKGHGFVHFEQESSAQNVIEKVNGMVLCDKQVYVGPFIRRQAREKDSGNSRFNNVFVKNLSEITTDEDLRKISGVHGTITSAVIMRDADGKSKCFGFVNFDRPEDAAKAVKALNGTIFNDKEWYVGRAQKKSEREARLERYQGVNLYLKNLDDTIDDEKLGDLFSEFGTITACKVMRDPQGQIKGSGFVAFSSSYEATRAVSEMNGKMIASKPLYVAPAQTKEERRARLQVQFAQLHSPVGVGAAMPTNLSGFHAGAPGIGQQVIYGQPPHSLIPSQPARYGYQQQVLTGLWPGGTPMPNFYVPMVQKQGQQGPRPTGRHGNPPQRQQQQGSTMMNSMLQVPLELEGMPVPSAEFPSALASAPADQHRLMLGEQLYPLVDQIEHDHAGKVTGMLLEMDQNDVLHLLESAEALKAKVREAMEMLHHAQIALPTDQLSALSLNEARSS
ncbi:hypothetical protein KP509_09G075700 [Ceratopteris richardii]|uniref:Polyadenylate-binding protein n=1 Tax=Ceratopteris richardii TaxID=49495 RepID=A0A8T2U8Q1_CERRI|nr:hypothetical protein KP509_09G075700 [Ceratopteris richardii]